jgi:hypothetical protein
MRMQRCKKFLALEVRKAIAHQKNCNRQEVQSRINTIMTQSTASKLLLGVGDCDYQEKILLPATDANAEV